jgi:hypothetical protein
MNRPHIVRGKVIGIGKIKVFPSNSLPFEIPMLSFVVLKNELDKYVSSCIQLHMDGYGNTPEEAREDMCENCIAFLNVNFTNKKCKSSAWVNLHDLFMTDDEPTVELWNAYRTVQLNLAEKGVCTDGSKALSNYINDLEKQIKELKSIIDKSDPEELTETNAKIIDYQECGEAA